MPFGLKGIPATCQCAADTIVAGIKYRRALVCMDGCEMFEKTFNDHVRDLQEVSTGFQKQSLKLKPKKCFFCSAVSYLGHVVTKNIFRPRKSGSGHKISCSSQHLKAAMCPWANHALQKIHFQAQRDFISNHHSKSCLKGHAFSVGCRTRIAPSAQGYVM